MPFYLIHACNQRMWYVKEYLIPSMLSQGIAETDILVYQDKNEIGNLRAWVDSCNRLVKQSAKRYAIGVWHLQDDIVLCKDFKRKTEEYSYGDNIVCGFTCKYDTKQEVGTFKVAEEKMWLSFPCIYIPTHILESFVDWANLNLWQSEYFNTCIKRNRSDDLVFMEWLYDNYPYKDEINVAPNLVNHIDYLLSGSVANKARTASTSALFWEDDNIVSDLKHQLDKRHNI